MGLNGGRIGQRFQRSRGGFRPKQAGSPGKLQEARGEPVTKGFTNTLERSPLVAALDLTVIHACSYLAIRMAARSTRAGNFRVYGHVFLLLSLAAVVSFSICGLYRRWSRRPLPNLVSTLFLGECLYVTAWTSLGGWDPHCAMTRSVIADAAALQLVCLAAERILIRRVVRRSEKPQCGVIVAEDLTTGQAVRHKLAAISQPRLSLCACLTAEEFERLTDQEISWDVVLLAQDVQEKAEIICRASRLGKYVYIIPGTLELWMVGAHPTQMDDELMLHLSPPFLRPGQRSIKRLADVAGSLCLLVLTTPFVIVASILIRLTSPGPALFRQARVGANGKEYTLFKLRTMVMDAEEYTGPVLASSRDPRVTGIGRFLRATRIDELPQLVNVLMGEMSLIGPRPERPHFVRLFKDQLPGYEFRLAVKPGITGLAQIYGRYSTSPELKLRFDLMYIYNYSLFMDIRILLQTILTVLQPDQAEGLKEEGEWTALKSED